MQVGIKHESRRDITDVAKLVRQDLKATFGKAWKFSVKISRFSMGQSLDVEIKAAPCCLYRRGAGPMGQTYNMTKACELAIETIDGILDSYNRQDIDLQTDYFNVDFYGNAQVNYKLRQRQLAALENNDA